MPFEAGKPGPGDPRGGGVGKTALLEYLIEHTAGFRVTRVAGHQWAVELPFSGVAYIGVGLPPVTSGDDAFSSQNGLGWPRGRSSRSCLRELIPSLVKIL